MRVLIVEDEKDLANVLSEMLELEGYHTDIANDGEYGLDCAMTGIYDLIILDIMLPKLDGHCSSSQTSAETDQLCGINADRKVPDRRQGRRIGQRCRRLSDETICQQGISGKSSGTLPPQTIGVSQQCPFIFGHFAGFCPSRTAMWRTAGKTQPERI